MAKPYKYPFREEDRPNRIRYWREERGLTLERVAERMGTTRATISGYETGRYPVTLARLAGIAEVLGVSTADLLMPQDNPLAADADGRRIMEAWREVPHERRAEMAETVVRMLRLVGGDSASRAG